MRSVRARSWSPTAPVRASCRYRGAVAAIDAISTLQVIDTTAAGDAFDAGYIAARLRGETPERSAVAGHALAATVVGHRGALAPRPALG